MREEMLNDGDPLLPGKTEETNRKEPFRLYKRRWVMLFIFSLNTMVNASLYIGISSISRTAATFYHQSEVAIEWLSNAPVIMYTLLAFVTTYFMFKKGIRPVLVAAAACDCIATMFRYYGFLHKATYWSLATGQIFTGISFAIVLQIPGQLSVKWFPENERAVATSLGTFANLFGVSLGYIQINHMVPEFSNVEDVRQGFQNLYLSQFLMASIVFLLTAVGYREAPPTNIECKKEEDLSFQNDIAQLFRNKNFLLISQTYAIYFGLLVSIPIILSPWVAKMYPIGYQKETGWMGFSFLMSSVISCYVTGILLDKYHLHHVVSIALNALSALAMLIFVLVLAYGKSYTGVFVMAVIFGMVSLPYFASGIEHAAEVTYPVQAITASTVLLVLGNFYGFLLILLLGYLIENDYVKLAGYLFVLLYLLSTLTACLTKTELHRCKAEMKLLENNEKDCQFLLK